MNMTLWSPFSEMENFFASYLRPASLGRSTGTWMPSVDVTEDGEAYLIQAELAGVNKEDIKVKVDNGVLVLSGERNFVRKNEKEHAVERSQGVFSRRFSLPKDVCSDNISADYKDGVLYLHLRKNAVSRPEAIDIEVQ